MRTREQGALAPADVIPTFGAQMQLEALAHGGNAYHARDCAACKTMGAALGEWLNAHMLGPDELLEMPSLDGREEMP